LAYQYRGTIRDIDDDFDEPAPTEPVFDTAKCGTYTGWHQHRKFGTEPCQSCKNFINEYGRVYRARTRTRRAAAPPAPMTIRDVCGTYSGYMKHQRNGEPKCADCKAANALYIARYRAGKRAAA
jgi:hypothetical protein